MKKTYRKTVLIMTFLIIFCGLIIMILDGDSGSTSPQTNPPTMSR